MMYCIGVDVGGTSVKMGLFETTGTLLEKWEIRTRKEENGKYVLPDVAASIREKLEQKKITMEELAGVGVGVPGPVREDGSVEVCVNLGWSEHNVNEELSELLGGVKVRTANDANVAALGEMWLGSGKAYKSLVMLTLGTGVGGGVVIDGKIIDGSHGAGGEVGHIIVNPDEEEYCNCGGRGCLEQYASATGVVRVTKRLLKTTRLVSVLQGRENFSAKQVFDAAKENDLLALQAVDVLGTYLGLAMSFISMTVDPEAFVIGGGVSRAGSILIDAISNHYDRYVNIIKKKADIVLAELGNDAGICGAAKLVL